MDKPPDPAIKTWRKALLYSGTNAKDLALMSDSEVVIEFKKMIKRMGGEM